MSIFLDNNNQNKFDNISISVKELYQRSLFKINYKMLRVYRNRIIPIKYRNYLWYFLRRTRLDQFWIDNFKAFWGLQIGARPLMGVEDFYFLKNLYRIKFQTHLVPDSDDPLIHEEAWQQPQMLYFLFYNVAKEHTRNELPKLRLARKYKKFNSFIEYGCGTAPITTTFFEFYKRAPKVHIYLFDIQTLAFRYAQSKFGNKQNVLTTLLTPANDLLPVEDIKTDVIFCHTVYEHMNKPLETTKRFYNMLNSGGLLVFDYIKSNGKGQDTIQGVNERNDVIDFINHNFKLLHGVLNKDDDIGLCVVKK